MSTPTPHDASLPTCIRLLMEYFETMKFDQEEKLDPVYADQIRFEDPLHVIEGKENLKAYFKDLNKNLVSGNFDFHTTRTIGNKVYTEWIMKIQLKRPNKTIQLPGISILTFEEKITSQRDYFDAGAMIYEHIPIIGGIIRKVKKKVGQG